ncbi:phosphopentomutase [Candidatus Sumerlaeota bacterium]|nr:phosphopentomutase [Candidatus Sumerlaeota bacterium]
MSQILHPIPSRRAIIIVLDGVGCGELPDAASFGDEGSNTLGNLSRWFEDGLRLPNLGALGLGNIIPIRGVSPAAARGGYGKCGEKSAGKDSTSGHWEIAGVVTPTPFPTYPRGFPPEIIAEFSRRIGRGILGNKPASGTEIIKELGEEHLRTGKPIVYTSADSVFQIAAHLSVYPLDELYRICRIAREILAGPHRVGRVIARPFAGEPGNFARTPDRQDFSVEPHAPTLLDHCRAAGIRTVGIGKIGDLFAHRGLDEEMHTRSNLEGIEQTIAQMRAARSPALIFTNLVEGDSVYGHRNDCPGYRKSLEEFDSKLPEIFAAQRMGDLMVICADHGVDPTTPSTDHSREYIPLLMWGDEIKPNVNLGVRETFADIGQTVADYLNGPPLKSGVSFLAKLNPAI